MNKKRLAPFAALIFSLILIVSTFSLTASAAKSIAKAAITVSSSAEYTGKALKPKVTVKLSGKKLNAKYYTVSYKNNKDIGKATVTVTGKNGYSGKASKSFKIVPGKVTNLRTAANATSIKLKWNKVAGATHYQVYMLESGKWVRQANTKLNYYTVKELNGATAYSFKVRAFKKVGSTYYTGAYSSVVVKSTAVPAPDNLKLTADVNSVKLTWNKVTNAKGYQVWIDKGDGWSLLGTTTARTYTAKNLNDGSEYSFRVRAYITVDGEKTYGSYSSKSTTTHIYLGSVTGLTVSDITYQSAIVSFNPVKGADEYHIELSSTETSGTKIITDTTFKVDSVNSGKLWKITVTPYSKETETYGEKATISFKIAPYDVSMVKVTENKSGSVTVESYVDPNADGHIYYAQKLDKNGNPLTTEKLASITADKLVSPPIQKYTATNLEGATDYRFKVVSFCKHESLYSYSEPVYSEVFKTLPSKVEDLKAVTSPDSVTLSWKAQGNIDGYTVYDQNGNELKTLNAANYSITGLTEGVNYTYTVKAYYLDGETKVYGDGVSVTATTKDTSVTSIEFTKKTAQMTAGETFKTEISILPLDASDKTVIYNSSNKLIATIDEKGVITAVSNGITRITVETPDGKVSDSFSMKVNNVVSTSISVPATVSCYVGESTTLKPTFTPANISNKAFTITAEDHTYSYKVLFTTKTDTCKFSDYFYIDNETGRIRALKETVEPETDKAFSFKAKVTASDSGVSCYFNLSSSKRVITISYLGDENPWYYGNNVNLTATVDSNNFKAENLRWSSSDTKIATVNSTGVVSCVGVGEVTITATSPDGIQSHSLTVYVRDIIKADKTYFEGCIVGQSYTIPASIVPASSLNKLNYITSDKSTATVDENGKVTFLKDGSVEIRISSAQADPVTVLLTTSRCTLPSGSKMELFAIMESSANKVKTDMPAIYSSTYTTFDNVTIVKETSTFGSKDLVDIFKDFSTPKNRYYSAVNTSNYPNSTSYSDAVSSYLNAIPVAGQNFTILPGLEESSIKKVEVIDSDSYTYDIKLTLNDEYMATPPTTPHRTAHGKIFDILENEYLKVIKEGLESEASGTKLSYSAFNQNYNNSSLTLTYNKVTGKLCNMKYNMNVHIDIIDLKLSMSLLGLTQTAIDSTVRFDVSHNVDIEVY